jgi:hypothetical protein
MLEKTLEAEVLKMTQILNSKRSFKCTNFKKRQKTTGNRQKK